MSYVKTYEIFHMKEHHDDRWSEQTILKFSSLMTPNGILKGVGVSYF